MGKTILYYDCFSGISGDMHLGAMLDLGVDPEHLLGQLRKLKLEEYEIRISKDQKQGISGTRVDVILLQETDSHDQTHQHENGHKHEQGHEHRNLADIRKIINDSTLDLQVKERSLKMFEKLAEAEAKIHGKSIDEVHFHEVGAVDSIVDIVGAAICIEYLKPDRIMASEVELGGGFVVCEHGTFPVPAPATAEILTGIPVRSGAVRFETTTPTGALILACNVDEFTPLRGMKIRKTAYGIGHKDLEIPNVLRVYLAETIENEGSREKAWILECNIDDMNPEMYGYVMDTLFAQGADDVFITPIIMKKARPASKLSVLCPAGKKAQLTEVLLTQTTSLGVRASEVDKTMLQREYSKIQTRYGEVTIKTAIYRGQKLKSKPEYEDCARLAREHGVPVQQIYQEISGFVNKEG
jgi:uncharacterized protein (TIGR00299 family) protein